MKVFNNDSTIYDTGGGFDCGTGLSCALIRPYEQFELRNVKIEEMIESLGFYVAEMRASGVDINELGDVNGQLYLPVFSLGHEKTRVYSNTIKLTPELLNRAYEAHANL